MQRTSSSRVNTIIYTISTSILLVGLILQIVVLWEPARYILLLGALGYLWAMVAYKASKETLRIRRLIRFAHFSGLLWLAGAICLFLKSELWIIFFTIACVFMLYSNIALSRRHRKSSDSK